MASDVSIANRALTKLGDDPILLLTDDVKRARVLRTMFNDVRDAELRAANWKFAIKRVELSALSEAPLGFDYQYPLPPDFIKLVQVGDIYVRTGKAGMTRWQLEGGRILTNYQAPLRIRYISRVTNAGLFDPLFAESLACKLAMEACEILTQSQSKYQQVAQQYKDAMQLAARMDAIENPPDELPDGSWLDSRGYGIRHTEGEPWSSFPTSV